MSNTHSKGEDTGCNKLTFLLDDFRVIYKGLSSSNIENVEWEMYISAITYLFTIL